MAWDESVGDAILDRDDRVSMLAGSRCLVTGAGGFIGSHLVEALILAGARVRAFLRYTSHGSAGFLEPIRDHPCLDLHFGDIRDGGSVSAATEGVDMVFHLAALIGIPYSYEAPRSYLDTNVEGTVNVLEAARNNGVHRVVVTSTSEVYGSALQVPMTEDHPLQAQSPYSASKIAADAMAVAFHRSFVLPVVVLRPFNTFGPRQSPRAVIPTILSQAIHADGCLHLGDLEPVRDFTYVSDTVQAFLLSACVAGVEGEVIHLGTGEGVKIGEIVDRVATVLDCRLRVEADSARLRPDRSEVSRLVSDPSRAQELLGWTARVSLEEGLRRTAAWIRDHPLRAPGEYRR